VLLRDADYEHLKTCGLDHAEDEQNRYLVLKSFPLPSGMYASTGTTRDTVDVLVRIPANYNTTGTDMLWVHPALERVDGKPIPNAHAPARVMQATSMGESFVGGRGTTPPSRGGPASMASTRSSAGSTGR
jgi:Prokaryotic E2 family E